MRRWLRTKMREAMVIPMLVVYILARWLTDSIDADDI